MEEKSYDPPASLQTQTFTAFPAQCCSKFNYLWTSPTIILFQLLGELDTISSTIHLSKQSNPVLSFIFVPGHTAGLLLCSVQTHEFFLLFSCIPILFNPMSFPTFLMYYNNILQLSLHVSPFRAWARGDYLADIIHVSVPQSRTIYDIIN